MRAPTWTSGSPARLTPGGDTRLVPPHIGLYARVTGAAKPDAATLRTAARHGLTPAHVDALRHVDELEGAEVLNAVDDLRDWMADKALLRLPR